jgi:hypothetical protein
MNHQEDFLINYRYHNSHSAETGITSEQPVINASEYATVFMIGVGARFSGKRT